MSIGFLVMLFIIFVAGMWMVGQQDPQEVARKRKNESHYLSNRAYYLAGKNMGKSIHVPRKTLNRKIKARRP